ncbi:hypothetical protein I4U23_011241 [Adineta vaga]|nr:hypothetical protein I4U23_011241 [Adineta vaga]
MRKQSQSYFIPLPTIQLSNSSMMQQPSTTTTTSSSSISMSTCTRATQTDGLSSTAELYQLAAHLHRLTGELVRACQAQNEAQQVTEMTMNVVVAPAAQTAVVEIATVHSLSLDDVNVDCMVVVSQMSKRLEQMINMDESVTTPTPISSPLKLPRGNVNIDKHVRDYLDSLIGGQPGPVEEDVLDLTPNPNLDVAFDGLSNSSSDDSFATANMLDDSIIECY